MKSWHPPLPSFNTFVIVFYLLFRRLAKRDAAAYADPDVISGNTRYAPISNPLAPGPVLRAYADPNVQTRYARDLVEEEGDARKANPELTKAYANPGYKQPVYKYVQFKLNYSGISCSILFA